MRAEHGARVVLEDVDVVARQGAGASLATSCMASSMARLDLDRCAWWCGVVGCMLFVPRALLELDLGLGCQHMKCPNNTSITLQAQPLKNAERGVGG